MDPQAASSDVIRRHLVVDGYVQGVGFRVNCARRARAAGLSGWVRNRDDGRVEMVLQGPPDLVADVERWCSHGPHLAQVTSVDGNDEPPAPERGFDIR